MSCAISGPLRKPTTGSSRSALATELWLLRKGSARAIHAASNGTTGRKAPSSARARSGNGSEDAAMRARAVPMASATVLSPPPRRRTRVRRTPQAAVDEAGSWSDRRGWVGLYRRTDLRQTPGHDPGTPRSKPETNGRKPRGPPFAAHHLPMELRRLRYFLAGAEEWRLPRRCAAAPRGSVLPPRGAV